MKNQALFFLKDKSKKLKCGLLQFFFGALRVKFYFHDLRNSLSFVLNSVAIGIEFVCANLKCLLPLASQNVSPF